MFVMSEKYPHQRRLNRAVPSVTDPPPTDRSGHGFAWLRGRRINRTITRGSSHESFNGRLRDELVNSWRFDSPLEARVIIEDHRIDYNLNRPDTAHGDLTPTEFDLAWNKINQPQAAWQLDHQTGPLTAQRWSAR
jgi:hypothetical protein